MTRQYLALQYATNKICEWDFAFLIEKIYLYGSFARGDYSWESDVDIYIVTKEAIDPIEIRKLRVSCMPEESKIADVDLKVDTLNELEYNKDLFYKNIRQDGVLLWTREK